MEFDVTRGASVPRGLVVDLGWSGSDKLGLASTSRASARLGRTLSASSAAMTRCAAADRAATAPCTSSPFVKARSRTSVSTPIWTDRSTDPRQSWYRSASKGMGLAAPQILIGARAWSYEGPDGTTPTLLNPRIIDESAEEDKQYEGCLSFFDVRGRVQRPLVIEVEHLDIDGTVYITEFQRGLARLVAQGIDHVHGTRYRSRMRPGVEPIPVSQYKGIGQRWSY